MIDLHAHILPGIDDGAAHLEASLDMARAMVDLGVTTVSCTPHIFPAMGWDNSREEIVQAVSRFAEALEQAQIELEVLPSAEHYYDGELLERVTEQRAVPVNLGRYILVEFSPTALPPDLPSLLFRFRRLGFEPLIAHVERYAALVERPELVDALAQQGYAMQVDAAALTGAFGWRQKRFAWRLLEKGVISVVASDAHQLKDLRVHLAKALVLLEKRLGTAEKRRLLVDNPRRIIDGAALDANP